MSVKKIINIFKSLKKKNYKELLRDKKIVFAITTSIIIFILFIWLIFKFVFSSYEESSPLDSVPADAAIIIDVKQADILWDDFSINSCVWRELSNIDPFRKINKDINILDSVFKINKCTSKIVTDHSIYISFHQLPDKSTGILYMTALAGNCNKTEFENIIRQMPCSGLNKSERKFMDIAISELQLKNRKEKFSYTISNDVFICSFQPSLIDAAIIQQKSRATLAKNPGFVKVLGTAGKKVNANIYINFKYFPQLFSLLTTDKYSKIISDIAGFAGWSTFDLNIKKDAILLNGFTQTEDNQANFLSLFTEQEPQETNLSKILPSSSASFLCYSFSNFDVWYKSYTTYLNKKGKLNARNAAIAKLNSKYKTDVEKNITNLIGNELALVITEPSDSNINTNMFAVIKTKNIENAVSLLSSQSLLLEQKTIKSPKKIKGKKGKNKKEKKPKIKENSKIKQRESSILEVKEVKSEKIYKYKISGVLSLLFGNLFNGVEGKYYAIIEDYVVFGNSESSLKSFLKDYSEEKTLQNNNGYINFSKDISSESNIYLYCNIKKSLGLFANYGNKDIVSYLENNISLFKNFDVFSCQFKTDGKLFYNNICFKTNTTIVDESNALWALNIDSTVLYSPKIVTDLSGKSKKLIVYDNAFNVYLIDNNGSLLWKVKLKEKPLSEVFVVDFFKNNKTQYILNTKSYIYLLSSDGKNADNFPVRLSESSTAPMSVLDYSNNKDYRLIIPCGNKVYNYTKEGALKKGWNIVKTKRDVIKNISHFKFNNTDCIIISDKEGNVYIVNKKGVEEIKIKQSFTVAASSQFYLSKNSKGKPCILTSDNNGNIIFISNTGDIEKKSIAKFSPAHFFLFEDFNNDKVNDYIFVDNCQLSVYNQDYKLICNYIFPSAIESPHVFFNEIGNKSAFGIISTKIKKIFIFKSDGTLKDGFPFNGSTFTIGNINNDGTLNLVVGSEQTIYNYAYE